MEQYTLAIVLTIAILSIVVVLLRRKIKHAWLNFKTRLHLNRLGLKQISNLQCPDGLGHYFNVDRLVMRYDGITVLVFKQYAGSIFCADHIDDWTQLLEGKSHRFNNPLVDLDYQVNAVSACNPDVPVNGYLFFGHQADFPKGHPDRVIHLKNIPEELTAGKSQKAKDSVNAAWNRLSELKRQ